MKLEVSRDALMGALKLTAGAVGRSGDLPVLSCVKLTLASNKLTLRTTDLDRAVTATVDVKASDDGTVLVPHATFSKIVSHLEPGTVTVVSEDNELVVSGGKARLTVPTLSETESFPNPAMPAGDTHDVDAGLLAEAISQVLPSASKDPVRVALTGVQLEGGQDLRLVTTDGYRLAIRTISASIVAEGSSALVPANSFATVPKVLGTTGTISVCVGENSVLFSNDKATVWTRLLDAAYPAYRGIIPAEATSTFSVDRAALTAAVERAMLVNDSSVNFAFDAEQVTLTVSGTGTGVEPVAGTLTGEPISVRGNPSYLLDGLSATNADTVTLEFTEPHKPIKLTGAGDSWLYVYMPMR